MCASVCSCLTTVVLRHCLLYLVKGPPHGVLFRMPKPHKVCCCSFQLMYSMPSADACVLLRSKWATRVRSSPSRVMTSLRGLHSTQQSRTPLCGPCSMQVGAAHCWNTCCCSVSINISAEQTTVSAPHRLNMLPFAARPQLPAT